MLILECMERSNYIASIDNLLLVKLLYDKGVPKDIFLGTMMVDLNYGNENAYDFLVMGLTNLFPEFQYFDSSEFDDDEIKPILANIISTKELNKELGIEMKITPLDSPTDYELLFHLTTNEFKEIAKNKSLYLTLKREVNKLVDQVDFEYDLSLFFDKRGGCLITIYSFFELSRLCELFLNIHDKTLEILENAEVSNKNEVSN